MQNLSTNTRPTQSESAFSQIPRWFIDTFKFKKHWSRGGIFPLYLNEPICFPLLIYLGLVGSQGGSPDLLSQKLWGEVTAECVLTSSPVRWFWCKLMLENHWHSWCYGPAFENEVHQNTQDLLLCVTDIAQIPHALALCSQSPASVSPTFSPTSCLTSDEDALTNARVRGNHLLR